MRTYKLFLYLWILFPFAQISAQEKVKSISDPNFHLFKVGEIAYFINDGNSNSINSNDILNKELTVLNSSVPNFGFIDTDVWFRFRIKNDTPLKKELYLSLSNANLDKVLVVSYDSTNKELTSSYFSDLEELEKRVFPGRKPIFPFSVQPGEEISFVLCVNNGGEQFHFDLKFQELNDYEQNENRETYFLGIFMGILFFTILLNSYLWLITKEKISVFYTGYLISLFLLQASLLGFAKLYFWPNSAYLTNHANPIFASISVLFLLLFARNYLRLSQYLPKADTVFKWISIPVSITIILSLIPSEFFYKTSIVLINGITLFLNLLILPVAVMVLRKGYKPATLFIVAFSVLVLSVFGFVLKNFGVLPSTFITDFGFQVGSTFEALLFSIGIILRFRDAQRDALNRLEEINILKQKANEELEYKVVERTREIQEQQQEIEAKNKEILSSIEYAKRIQEAILPDIDKVQRTIPNAAILYLPKDIVSGDFYWLEEKKLNDRTFTFFAAADCTGHGVPGAMMSVLCSNLLNRCMEESMDQDPSAILEETTKLLKLELGRNSNSIQDGMDISLGVYDKVQNKLFWSGANNPLWILRNSEIIELDPVKRPVGLSPVTEPFKTIELDVIKGDQLILFSDGIIDQFGGVKGKKLRKTGLREWLHACHTNTPQDIISFIKGNLFDWMKNEEQIDDILIMVLPIHDDRALL